MLILFMLTVEPPTREEEALGCYSRFWFEQEGVRVFIIAQRVSYLIDDGWTYEVWVETVSDLIDMTT